jgi:hypothetical protein
MPPRFRYPDVTDVVADASVPTDISRASGSPRRNARAGFPTRRVPSGGWRRGCLSNRREAQNRARSQQIDGLKSAEWRGWCAVVDQLAGSDIRDVRRPALVVVWRRRAAPRGVQQHGASVLARTLTRWRASVRAVLGAGRGG